MKPNPSLILTAAFLLPASILQAADLTAGYVIGGAPFNGTNVFVDQAANAGGDTNATTGNQSWVAVLTDRWLPSQNISITGLAIPIRNDSAAGTLTFTFYDIGADNTFTGVANETELGSATVNFTPTTSSAHSVVFDTPVNFTSEGTGIAMRISSSASARFKISTAAANYAVRLNAADGAAIATNPAFRMTLAGVNNSFMDADLDGLQDGVETNTGVYISKLDTGTDPNDPDTDNDFFNDGPEITSGTSPVRADSDRDGILDGVEANPLASGYTGTNPNARDTDGDGLGDKYEIENSLNATANADFDGDTFTDADEILFYGSDPKSDTSFPGDGTAPAPGSFTAIQNGGTIPNGGSLDIPATLENTIINEASGGGSDFDFASGVTNFTYVYPNLFPSAGSEVSLTGFAWNVTNSVNVSGDIRLEFYDLGADGAHGGLENEVLVGVARGTLTVSGATSVMYWNFAPINFTSLGTALGVRIISTNALRLKGQDNSGSALWVQNTGLANFGNIRASRLSIGGTVVAPLLPRILTITRAGTSTSLTWELGNAATVDLERSTDLGQSNPWTKVLTGTAQTSYMETSSDPRAFFRLVNP